MHDGGVAVGANPEEEGVEVTLYSGRGVDPRNSLRALIERKIRRGVITANHASLRAGAMHIEGIGHEFWIDRDSGYSAEDQDRVIDYLLTLTGE